MQPSLPPYRLRLVRGVLVFSAPARPASHILFLDFLILSRVLPLPQYPADLYSISFSISLSDQNLTWTPATICVVGGGILLSRTQRCNVRRSTFNILAASEIE